MVAIEVKDWNVTKNSYQWRDQYTILKTSPDGTTEELHNPLINPTIYK
jgi:hypothetical protein